MMRLAALALTLVLAAPVPTLAQPQPESNQGVLLLAHGGRSNWNDAVLDLARELNATWPTEVAFGMATRRTIQDAVDRLNARGVETIVAVPLFISSHSPIIRATEYLLGLRQEAPPELAAFARMDHGESGASRGTHGTTNADRSGSGAHDGHDGHRANDADADATSPVTSRAAIRMTEALDRHPLVTAMLADRAASISRDPAREVVVLVAHGPVSDEDNVRWLADMEALAGGMRAKRPFKRIEFLTVRDDAPEPVRANATAELRERVAAIAAAGDRALIVPLLLAFGGIEEGIRTRLDELDYVMAPQGLLPDPRLGDWVRAVVRDTPR